jgi:hypothetical protein
MYAGGRGIGADTTPATLSDLSVTWQWGKQATGFYSDLKEGDYIPIPNNPSLPVLFGNFNN